jgi:hypothetical protein
VAKWDGTSWSDLGQGAASLNAMGTIYGLVTDSKDNIYACGGIYLQSTSGGGGGYYVAKWNGQAWSIFGAQLFNDDMYALAIDQYDNLYTTGFFTNGYGNHYVDKYGYNSAGIQQPNESRFNLYPNPVKDYFTIKTDANLAAMLQLTDVSGRIIQEGKISLTGITQIDVRTAPTGLYFARITDNTGRTYVQKLTITKR